MTPRDFKSRMEEIVSGGDLGAIKREGQKLICRALGENAPAFLDGLELYMDRLEKGEAPRARSGQEAPL